MIVASTMINEVAFDSNEGYLEYFKYVDGYTPEMYLVEWPTRLCYSKTSLPKFGDDPYFTYKKAISSSHESVLEHPAIIIKNVSYGHKYIQEDGSRSLINLRIIKQLAHLRELVSDNAVLYGGEHVPYNAKLETFSKPNATTELGCTVTLLGATPQVGNLGRVTFLLDGVSLVATQQILRTRSASYTQQSLRYVDARELDYVRLPEYEGYDAHIQEAFELYVQARGNKMHKENARYILPVATKTSLVMSANLTDWWYYCTLRRHKKVQYEHRIIADEIYKQLGGLA